MKKIALTICMLLIAIGVLASCDPMFVRSDDAPSGDVSDTPAGGENNDQNGENNDQNGETGDVTPPDDGTDTPSDGYLYSEFTADELALFGEYFDFVIPFMPTNDYGVEAFVDEETEGIYYYTVGNTREDFENYLESLVDFTLSTTEVDEYGDTWYGYDRGDACFDFVFYEYEGETYLEGYLYISTSEEDSSDTESGLKVGQGYLIQCENASGTYYFNGTVSSGIFGATSNVDSATVVYVERSGEGYLIYFLSGTSKQYIVMEDGSAKGAIVSSASSATVFEWNSYYETLAVMEDSVNRAFGMKPESTDTSLRCYDLSNTTYNFGKYVPYGGTSTPGGTTPPDSGDSSGYLYTEFTSSELSALRDFAGIAIPFIPTNEYYLEEYTYENEVGLNFYTYGNTEAEFKAFLLALSGFTSSGSEVDVDGDTWYYYERGEYLLDAVYYLNSEGVSIIDVFIYVLSDNSGSGGSGSVNENNVLTNDGAGLPEGNGGVYEIVFTDALYVKDVTEQYDFADGCPTTGSPAVLVIPVDFSNRTAKSLGYSIDAITSVLAQGSEGCDYYSLYDYYYISSYGQLQLDITVLDFWFRPSKPSSYYETATINFGGEELEAGEQLIIDEALAYLEPLMDLSRFDSDDNGTIDSVMLVNTVDINYDSTLGWAFRYWNLYADNEGYYYDYDGVSAYDYLWIPYKFIFEDYAEDGSAFYSDTTVRNPYTFIHEFGHALGAIDYYDTAYVEHPMDGYDMMDAMFGDHNPYTKFNYGWIKTSRLVTATSSVTLSLENFSKNGDTIIFGSNWDPDLGVYQEYYVIMLYRAEGLNGDIYGYFSGDGIVVYRVNASLIRLEDGDGYHYNVYNNNTNPSDTEYGTEDNLIELVESPDGDYLFEAGEKAPTLKDSSGKQIGYSFTVNSITASGATITFNKV